MLSHNNSTFAGAPEKLVYGSFIIVSVFILMITIIIICGNMLTVIAVAKFEILQTKTNTLIASLAVVDLTTGLYSAAFVIHYTVGGFYSKYNKICLIKFLIMIWPNLNSVFHLTCIAAERYIAVLHPLN